MRLFGTLGVLVKNEMSTYTRCITFNPTEELPYVSGKYSSIDTKLLEPMWQSEFCILCQILELSSLLFCFWHNQRNQHKTSEAIMVQEPLDKMYAFIAIKSILLCQNAFQRMAVGVGLHFQVAKENVLIKSFSAKTYF